MRTTVNLNDALDQQLRRKATALGISYREALTRAVRAGIEALDGPSQPYRVHAKDCGIRPGLDWQHLNRLADELEDQGH